MRQFILALLCLVLLFATACKKNDSDSPSSNRIASVFTRKVSDNTISGGLKYKYDNAGNLIQYFASNVLVTDYKYDAQNRLSISSEYEYGRRKEIDSFVYRNANLTHVYHSTIGVISPQLTHALVYDGRNRLILDSVYNSSGIRSVYNRYNYTDNDDLQSIEAYGSAYNSTGITYYRQDSTVYTHDENENPYYKIRLAVYFLTSPLTSLSKHNVVSRTIFGGTSTQSTNYIPFTTTYYKNGLLRTQIFGTGANSDYRREYLYQ